MKILNNSPLSKFNTIHLGGIAKKIYFPKDTSDLQNILKNIKTNFIVIGNGSNIAFKDTNFNGHVIILNEFEPILKNHWLFQLFQILSLFHRQNELL